VKLNLVIESLFRSSERIDPVIASLASTVVSSHAQQKTTTKVISSQVWTNSGLDLPRDLPGLKIILLANCSNPAEESMTESSVTDEAKKAKDKKLIVSETSHHSPHKYNE